MNKDKFQNINKDEFTPQLINVDLVKNLIAKIKNAGFKIKTRPHYNDMGFLIARK